MLILTIIQIITAFGACTVTHRSEELCKRLRMEFGGNQRKFHAPCIICIKACPFIFKMPNYVLSHSSPSINMSLKTICYVLPKPCMCIVYSIVNKGRVSGIRSSQNREAIPYLYYCMHNLTPQARSKCKEGKERSHVQINSLGTAQHCVLE